MRGEEIGMIITRKRAIKDPVLGKFIEYAAHEISMHRRFKAAPIIKAHDELKPYRQWINDNLTTSVRRVLETDYEFGTLIPISLNDELAGKGHGTRTVGYVRACAENESIVDECLDRKRGIAVGIQAHHNLLSEIISEETGEERPQLTFQIGLEAVAEEEHE
jgi:hypothetical protein